MYRLLAITVCICCFGMLQAQTLKEVLQLHHVPTASLQADELNQPITSFAVSENASSFLIAYDKGRNENFLPPDLHVLRYDFAAQHWIKADLHGKDLPFTGFDHVSKKLPADCIGSALSIVESDAVITIGTHINPSAGCILILSSGLQFKAALYGWTLARLRNAVLYEGAMVHFAPVHAGSLYLYDLRQQKSIRLYPQAPDSDRATFSNELRKNMPTQRYCMELNLKCDPSSFSTAFRNVHVDEPQHRIEADVRMTPEGFGPDAEDNVEPRTVHYTYTRNAGGWHRTAP